MPVSGITQGASSKAITDTRQNTGPGGFSKVLNDAILPQLKNSSTGDEGQATPIELGKISDETPTVSHILISHPEYAHRCWDIVFSPENQGKEFTKMREGTTVALKPGSNEIIWGSENFTEADYSKSGPSEGVTNVAEEIAPEGKSIVIGTISADSPTVSHLFEANPHFPDRRFWDIINAPVNINNENTTLRSGTRVELDPSTMKLSFINN
ncbi:MAG: hypothetical protein HZC49_14350, partial [Nitrospirae bacterium]|nr:hypothetical protein [Nitrospirota bacterium]